MIHFEIFINSLTEIILDHESIEYIKIMKVIKLNSDIEYVKDKTKIIQDEYMYSLLQR